MKPINSLPPFKRFCVTIGNLPSSYVDSMSYYECIMWLCKYLKDTVVPTVNENAKAVNELINWFNNLDVQDEINNKLDEMVESGELQEIISEYLNSKAIFGFDSVDDMKSATNLINGSYAKTLGYYSINDNGGATYKIRTITNEDIVDEGSIIALNDENLVAELVEKEVNVKMFGAKGDGIQDDSSKFNNAIAYLDDNSTLYIPDGTYIISETILLPDSISIKGINGIPTIKYTGSTICIQINGHDVNEDTSLGSSIASGESKPIISNLNIISDTEETYAVESDGIGIKFNNTSSTTIARSYIENVHISHFYKAIETTQYNFYIFTFKRLNIMKNYYGLYIVNGTNLGEKITIEDSVISVNRIGIHIDNANTDLNIFNTSIDYNICGLHGDGTSSTRKISIMNCHIEEERTTEFDPSVASYPYGLVYNLHGMYNFINNKTLLNLSVPQFNFTNVNNYKSFNFIGNEWNWWDTNYSNLPYLNHNIFLTGNYNKYKPITKVFNNNSLQSYISVPYSLNQFENKTPYLTNVFATGDVTITDYYLYDSSNRPLNLYNTSNVNISKFVIGDLDPNLNLKGLKAIPTDSSAESSFYLSTDIIKVDNLKNYAKYFVGKNIKSIEVRLQFYNGTTYVSQGNLSKLMGLNNTTPDEIISFPVSAGTVENILPQNMDSIRLNFKVTGIVGKEPELYVFGLYNY